MKQFLCAVAAVALFAAVGVAEDQPTTPPTVASGAPVVEYAPAASATTAAPARRGLFGRLRNRNTSTMSYSTPATGVPMTSAVPMPSAPTPMPPVAPQPMPTIRPTGGATVTPDGIVLVGGTASGATMTAGYTEPKPARRGLFGRLRNR